MFCPQCGQQQLSDAARFCSRCGFQLAVVSSLLATGGAAPESAFENVHVPDTPRREGARLGGKLMMSGMFLVLALAIISELIGTPDDLAILGLLVFFAGLFRLLYALIFEDGPYRKSLQRGQTYVPPQQFAPPHAVSALPPQQSMPARGYAPPPQQRPDTADFGYRPSVTEGTTRLLERERDESAR